MIDDKDGGDTKKNIDYGIKITPKVAKNKIHPSSIEWYDDGPGSVGQVRKRGEKRYNKNLSEKLADDNGIYTTTVKAGYKDLLEKSIDVEWVESYDNKISYLEKFENIFQLAGELNKFSKKFKNVIPCEASIAKDYRSLIPLGGIEFSIRSYNKEISNSRELNNIKHTKLKLVSGSIASLKCSKSLGWGTVSLGNIFLKVNISSNIDLNYKYKKSNETEKVGHEAFMTGGIGVSISGGLETNPVAEDYIYASASISAPAGVKIEWPFNGDRSKLGGYLYTGKVTLNLSGYVDGWLVGGKHNISTSFNLIDTQWEQEEPWIINLTNED